MPIAKSSLVLALSLVALAAQAAEPNHRNLSAVPFTAVKLQDGFWAPRIRTNRQRSLPHNFKWCEETGRISNFAKAAGLMRVEGKEYIVKDGDVIHFRFNV